MSGPTLFQLSYALLWMLALTLIPISIVLLYLLAQLQARGGHSLHDESKLIRQKMPDLSAQELPSGAVRPINELRGQLRVVLVLSPDCASCLRLIEEIRSVSPSDVASIPLLLLCKGQFERCRAVIADIQRVPALALDWRDAEAAGLRLAGVPAAIFVDHAGTVIDVRHPTSFREVITAIESARKNGDESDGQQSGTAVTEAVSSP